MSDRKPIDALTGLRFLAAMCVVISHALPVIMPVKEPSALYSMLTSLSAIGMSLFFVLSGFVIYYNYAGSVRTGAGLYNFFIARFARLYPLYFFCLCVDLLLGVLLKHNIQTYAAIPFYLTLTQSWFYLPLGNSALIYQFGSIATVSWSISTEVFLYLTFPFVGFLLAGSPRRTAFIAAALCATALLLSVTLIAHKPHIFSFGLAEYGAIGADVQNSFYRWLMYFSPYARLAEFLLGCAAAALLTQLDRPTEREERIGAWIAMICLAAIGILHAAMFGIAGNAQWHVILQGLHMNFGYAPLIAALIFCCARYRNPLAWVLSRPILLLLGEASYSIYLLHSVVLGRFRVGGPFDWMDDALFGGLARLLVAFLAVFILSLITWRTIEMPSRRWLRKALQLRSETTRNSVPSRS